LLLAAGPAGLKHPAATLFPPFLPLLLRANIIGGRQSEQRSGESSRRQSEDTACRGVELGLSMMASR
jgi:hypothetical protein